MDDVIIPYQIAKGMVVIGSFVSESTEEEWYVWIRRFESEDERKRLYALVYENDYWQKEISPQIGEMIDRTGNKITRITATPKSAIQ
jgi:hypothetical protein